MKIVFLDVDGVLHTGRYDHYQFVKKGIDYWDASFNFDPVAMKNLKEIVLKNDAKIVISSAWRYGEKYNDTHWRELMRNLEKYGLKDRVIGCTPNLASWHGIYCRGHEIQRWLDDNEELGVNGIVILDDCNDMHHLINYLARCPYEYGITKEVKEEALKIINNVFENKPVYEYNEA